MFRKLYTEFAGLEFPVNLCIAWSFSRQIATGNAKLQTVSEKKFSLGPNKSNRVIIF